MGLALPPLTLLKINNTTRTRTLSPVSPSTVQRNTMDQFKESKFSFPPIVMNECFDFCSSFILKLLFQVLISGATMYEILTFDTLILLK